MSKRKPSTAEISGLASPRSLLDSGNFLDRNTDFKVWIGVLLFAGEDSSPLLAEHLRKYSNGLHDCINTGLRQRFVSIKKTELVQWANDKHDMNVVHQELKSFLNSHPRGHDVPDHLLLKILIDYLRKILTEHLESRNITKSSTSESIVSDLFPMGTSSSSSSAAVVIGTGTKLSAKQEKEKRGEGSSRESTTRSASKKNKDSVSAFPNSTSGASFFTNKGKLRNRQIHRFKQNRLDDEPVDGPDLYIVLQQFTSLSFLELLLSKDHLPIHSVTAIIDFPTIPNALHSFHHLKKKFISAPASTMTFFTVLSFSSLTNFTSPAFFDAIAFHYYALSNEEQEYEHYYLKHPSIRIPKLQIPDFEFVAKDKSVEKEVLDDLVTYLSSFELEYSKASFGVSETCEEKKPLPVSRLEMLLKYCIPEEPVYEWNRDTFAKLSNLSPSLAEHYMDLYHFESLLSRSLDSFTWVESLSEEKLLKHLESVLITHPHAQTRIQPRGNKLLIAVMQSKPTTPSTTYPLIPMKLSLGDWYELKTNTQREFEFNDLTYDMDPFLFNLMQRISMTNGVYSINEPAISKNTKQYTLTYPNILCSVSPGQFHASFPYNGSKLSIQLASSSVFSPFKPTSSSVPFNTLSQQNKVIYFTSNGWMCFRTKEKIKKKRVFNTNTMKQGNGNTDRNNVTEHHETEKKEEGEQEEVCFYIQPISNEEFKPPASTPPSPSLSPSKPSSANASQIPSISQSCWRKIYKNGDQWIQTDQEVHFYGHDGKRGYLSLFPSTPSSSSWTWITPFGEVWTQHQLTSSPLKIIKHIHPQNGTIQYWREDDVMITLNPDGSKKVKHPDGTTIFTDTDGHLMVHIPNLGDLKLLFDDFLFTEVNGTEIQFSDELMIKMPQDFLLFTSFNHHQVYFPGYSIDLKLGEYVSVDPTNINLPEKALNMGKMHSHPMCESPCFHLFVLQKSPFSSYIFYEETSIQFIRKLIQRQNSPRSLFSQSIHSDTMESLSIITLSNLKQKGVRQFTKFPPLSNHDLRNKLEAFFQTPPELVKEATSEPFDSTFFLTQLKSRVHVVPPAPSLVLFNDLLCTPNFEKMKLRKQVPRIPFQPCFNPECKRFKFVPLPYFQSAQGLSTIPSFSNSIPSTFDEEKKVTRSIPEFKLSNFPIPVPFPEPSLLPSSLSTPKLVPKGNKASRLRQSKNSLHL